MTLRYWKMEKNGELSAREVAAEVGASGHILLRTDIVEGKTTIYFAGKADHEHAKAVQSHATEIKLADITKS